MRGRPKIYASDAERQTARRVRRYAAGLNSQGKPYQRRPNFVNHSESPFQRQLQIAARRAHKRKADRLRQQRIAAEFKQQGLRVDGQPFRRHQKFHAWKNFRREIVVGPVSFEDTVLVTAKGIYQ